MRRRYRIVYVKEEAKDSNHFSSVQNASAKTVSTESLSLKAGPEKSAPAIAVPVESSSEKAAQEKDVPE
jgi:hypothetical protein